VFGHYTQNYGISTDFNYIVFLLEKNKKWSVFYDPRSYPSYSSVRVRLRIYTYYYPVTNSYVTYFEFENQRNSDRPIYNPDSIPINQTSDIINKEPVPSSESIQAASEKEE